VSFFANDTSNNINNTIRTNFTVNDARAPAVFDVRPTAGSLFNVSELVTISANVTDDVSVDFVRVNITFANATTQLLSLARDGTTDKYNNTFTAPNVLGLYNVSFFANDSSNNINNTIRTNFTIRDVVAPNVTIDGCTPNKGNISQSILCKANVTDDVSVSVVQANVTLPNGSIQIQTVVGSSPKFNFTFTNTVIPGKYNVTWIANDTTNNIQTASDSFNITDAIAPVVVLTAPVNAANFSNVSITFNFTATDNVLQAMNCSLFVDSTLQANNASVTNGSPILFAVGSFSEGSHAWNVTCADSSLNTNTSETRTFRLDGTSPVPNELFFVPNSTDDVDPGVIINFTANVTDNLVGVHTVFLQTKLSSDTEFNNTLMSVISNSLFNASFNFTVAGTYNVRIFANDTVNNNVTSNLVNITVEFDRTWLRSPSTFTPIIANSSQNVTLGNLLINNTGDFSLNFTINSSSVQTRFNESANFTLAPKTTRSIQVNDTASSGGVKSITLNISASPNAAPVSQTTTGSIVVAPGQPVLVVTFITPSVDILEVDQGQTGVQFHAIVNNTGQGNATNVTLNITLPSSWTITFGTPHKFIGDLLSGDNGENIVQITIPSNETLGVVTVTANATGGNDTGFNLGTLSLIFADTVQVNVTEAPPPLAPTGGGGGGGGAPSPAAPGVGGGGGGGVARLPFGETIVTQEEFTAIRGTAVASPIILSNFYENSVLEDVVLTVEGFFSQYVRIVPIIDPNKLVYVETQRVSLARIGVPVAFTIGGVEHTLTPIVIGPDFATVILASTPKELIIGVGETRLVDVDDDGIDDVAVNLNGIANKTAFMRIYRLGPPEPGKLYFLENRRYDFSVFAPPFILPEEFNLTVKISADIVALFPGEAGFDRKPLLEYRTVTFRIITIAPETVQALIEEGKNKIAQIEGLGLPTDRLKDLLNQAQKLFAFENYELSFKKAEELNNLATTALDAVDLISDIEEAIQRAKERRLKTARSEESLALTRKALERGDYELALERAKETQLTLFLETRGRVNLLYFLKTYWWALILGSLLIYIISFKAWQRTIFVLTNARLRSLQEEAETIKKLIRDAQEKRFRAKAISGTEFSKAITQHYKRFDDINRELIKLRNRRIKRLRTSAAIADIQKEKSELAQAIREAQEDYISKGVITKERFEQVANSSKKRIAELDREELRLREKIKKKQ
jgi:hypothetical protein